MNNVASALRARNGIADHTEHPNPEASTPDPREDFCRKVKARACGQEGAEECEMKSLQLRF